MSEPDDQDRWMDFTIEDQLLLGHPDVADADCIAAETADDLARLCADILPAQAL